VEAHNWPDLLLIDGGAGQFSTAQSVLEELGCDVPLLCIAKGEKRNAGREEFFMAGREPFRLPAHHPVLHYLERLRDEAHRFAISSHRIKRANALTVSELDQIPGIGAGRKKALLHHFGSAKAVADAPLEALKSVPGISSALAENIHAHFRG
jgi:excinuclease ABC subunit C